MSVFEWLFSRQKRGGGPRTVPRLEPIPPAAAPARIRPAARQPPVLPDTFAPPEPAAPSGPAPVPEAAPILHGVVTFHGTRLVTARETGEVGHLPEEPGAEAMSRVAPLFAWLPEGRPDVCFLIAGEGGPETLHIENDPLAGPVISMLVAPGPAGSAVFSRPLSPFHLCAEPQNDAAVPGRVVADRSTPDIWEQFVLAPIPADTAPEATAARLAPLVRLFRGPLDGVTILAFLEEEEGAPALIEAVARLLPADDLAWLGRRVLGSERALTRLGGARAVWTREALPDLAAWLAGAVPR